MEFVIKLKDCSVCPFSWAEYPECELDYWEATDGTRVRGPNTPRSDKRPEDCPFNKDGSVTITIKNTTKDV